MWRRPGKRGKSPNSPRPSPVAQGRATLIFGRLMDRVIFLIQVSRPILWPVLPMVYYLGLHAAGAGVTVIAVVQMMLLTMPMNLIGCGLNDIYDIESDRLSSRRRAAWGAVVREEDRAAIWRACLA